MPFGKFEERHVKMMHAEIEKRESQHQREQIGRINACEAGLPEVLQRDVAPGIGVNQDESGQNEEEADADIANAGQTLEPLGSGDQSHGVHGAERYMKGRERTQGGTRE